MQLQIIILLYLANCSGLLLAQSPYSAEDFDFRIIIDDRYYQNNQTVQYGLEEIKQNGDVSLNLGNGFDLSMMSFRVVWCNGNDPGNVVRYKNNRKERLAINVGLLGVRVSANHLYDNRTNGGVIMIDAPQYEPQKSIVHIFKELYYRNLILDSVHNTVSDNIALVIVKIYLGENETLRKRLQKRKITQHSRLFFILWNRDLVSELPEIITLDPKHYTAVPLTDTNCSVKNASQPPITPVIFYDLTQEAVNQDAVYRWVKGFETKGQIPFFFISNGASFAFNKTHSELPGVLEEIYNFPILTPHFLQELKPFYNAFHSSEIQNNAIEAKYYFLLSTTTTLNLKRSPELFKNKLNEVQINLQDIILYVREDVEELRTLGFRIEYFPD